MTKKQIVPIIVLIFCSLNFSTAASAKKLKVMIDPGHGGEDFGAQHNGVIEKQITLEVAQKLYKVLKEDSRFQTEMTRSTDQYLSLEDRSQRAEKAKVDVFVSIHANSSDASSARGTEVYFENQIPTDEESMRTANIENNVKIQKKPDEKPSDLQNILNDLGHSMHMTHSSVVAQNILESMQKNLNIKTRAIRQAPFHVLSVSMPATLVETGFISNEKDAAWLKDNAVQLKIAKSIHDGLIRYKEKLDKTSAGQLQMSHAN